MNHEEITMNHEEIIAENKVIKLESLYQTGKIKTIYFFFQLITTNISLNDNY